MKDLFLVLKSEWYDMIESGEKKEEYREIKPYWFQRLFQEKLNPKELAKVCEWLKGDGAGMPYMLLGPYPKDFDTITFQKGYSKKNRMTFKFEGIAIDEPKPEWSGGMKGNHFIIKIGERIKCQKHIN